MKILIVSNLYPPHYLGGYEVHCAHVAEGLRASGHEVEVLTSDYGAPRTNRSADFPREEPQGSVPVRRRLQQYVYPPQPRRWPWTPAQARHELSDARLFLEVVNEFQPDVVNWWNILGLTKLLLPIPNRLGIPDVHAIDDLWLTQEYGLGGRTASGFWSTVWDGEWGPAVMRPIFRFFGRRWERKTALEGIPTRTLDHLPAHVVYLSDFLRKYHENAGMFFPSTEVIHGGVHVERFHGRRADRDPSRPVRFLYASQLTEDRELHTVLEAFAGLPPELQSQASLTVAGGGHELYVARVKEQVRTAGLTGRVTFLGQVAHADLPQVYIDHDVLVFSSRRKEGYGFVNVEAMMAGCAVLTTGSGGALEIALAADLPRFPAGDAGTLSRLVARLVTDRAELQRLAARAQEVAIQEFSFSRMIEKWNAALERVVESRKSSVVVSGAAKVSYAKGGTD